MTEPSAPPTLPSERTALAWERTAVSAVTIAGVVMFHRVDAARVTLSIAALVLALVIWVLSRRRRGRRTPPYAAVPIVGWGTTTLAVVLLAGLFITGG